MKKTFVTQSILLALAMAPLAAQAIVAGGMAVVHREWSAPTGGYDDMEFSATITKAPGFNGRTYWAHQWSYVGKESEGGYMGLQSRNGNDKALNFSIWGALRWENQGDASCNHFGHEGSGVQCWINYPWKEGVTYRLKLEKTKPNGWTASIINSRTGEKQTVATIIVPDTYGGLHSLSEWTENFAQGSEQPASCQNVTPAIVTFGIPTANQGSVTPSSSNTYTYGNCAQIARATCSAEQVCTQTVNIPVSSEPMQIKNLVNQYCLTHQGTNNPAMLDYCKEVEAQRFIKDDFEHLKSANNASQCLSVDSRHDVVMEKCDNTANQRWLPVRRTNAIYNAGTGLCLDATANGAFGAPLRVYPCLENIYQSWEISRPSPDKPDDKIIVNAGEDFSITTLASSSVNHPLKGVGKNADSYKWTIEGGIGPFWLQTMDSNGWTSSVNGLNARALFPANTEGTVRYCLTASKKGKNDVTDCVKVEVTKQAQNNDQAFINALSLSMKSVDNGNSVTFSGSVTSSSTVTSTPGYAWTLPAGAQGGSNGQALQSFTVNKTSQEQNLKVKVKVTVAEKSRELDQDIRIEAKDDVGAVPTYDASKTYDKKCTSVSHNGKVWQNQWYLNAGQEEPGKGGAWGGWREVRTSSNSCS